MTHDENEWEYHQDGRDRALAQGCFTVIAIIVGAMVIAISAALVG